MSTIANIFAGYSYGVGIRESLRRLSRLILWVKKIFLISE